MKSRSTRKLSNGKKRVLCYTGIKSRKNGVHTRNQFSAVTKKIKKSKPCRLLNNCPRKGNLKGWMKYTGAEYMTNADCRKAAKNVQTS